MLTLGKSGYGEIKEITRQNVKLVKKKKKSHIEVTEFQRSQLGGNVSGASASHCLLCFFVLFSFWGVLSVIFRPRLGF